MTKLLRFCVILRHLTVVPGLSIARRLLASNWPGRKSSLASEAINQMRLAGGGTDPEWSIARPPNDLLDDGVARLVYIKANKPAQPAVWNAKRLRMREAGHIGPTLPNRQLVDLKAAD